jgi:hypothetical protein
MTTLADLDRIVPDVIGRLDKIRSNMSRYKKINTDFRAKTLMNEIEAKIRQIKKVHEAYRNTPSYRNKNFDNWVGMQENYIAECTEIYKRIMEFEDVDGYLVPH